MSTVQRYDGVHERETVGFGAKGFFGFSEVMTGIQPGREQTAVVAILFLLAGCWSAAIAQVGPCAGEVEYTGIEGVGSVGVLTIDNHRMVTSDGPTVSNWRLGDPSAPEVLGRWTLDGCHVHIC